jgi:hypothetical protein
VRNRHPAIAAAVALTVVAVVGASCSSGSDDSSTGTAGTTAAPVTEPVPTDPPVTDPPATDPPATDPPATDPSATEVPITGPPTQGGTNVYGIVERLASDELQGRNNDTPESVLAQEFIVGELSLFAEPAVDGSFLQSYDIGTNIIGIVPGGELADEYVLVGAHYDHLGPGECFDFDLADDDICNGAADNASGVAAAIEVVRTIAAEGVPRRSIVIALWDAEEDGLVGSARYVADPIVPLDQTIAYVNFDIQGANLLPSLENTTIMVGAETGGPNLLAAALAATDASTLDTASFSIIFGQGRSDHANLAAAGVPSVFFTDANNGCYHTVKDDIDAVDFGKLDKQILTATALTTDLVDTDTPPVFDGAAPVSNYDDAVELLAVVRRGEPDLALLGPETEAVMKVFITDLQSIVDAGAAGYDDVAIGTVLGGAADLVAALADRDCSPV